MRRRIAVGMLASFAVLGVAHAHTIVMSHRGDMVCWVVQVDTEFQVYCGDPKLRPDNAGPTFPPKDLPMVLHSGETTLVP